MLLAGQFLLFLSSGLAWQGVIDAHILLPPLDRAVTVFSLVWIVWLWGFSKPARLGDLVTGFLNLGVVLLFIFTYASWTVQGTGQAFNNHWVDWVWELAGLVIVLTWDGNSLILTPCWMGLWSGYANAEPGWLRGSRGLGWKFKRLFRIHPFKPARGVPPSAHPASANHNIQSRRSFSEAKEERGKGRKIEPLCLTNGDGIQATRAQSMLSLSLKEKEDPQKAGPVLAKAIAHTMLADLCYIVTVPKFNQVSLLTGYDLVREEELEGTFLDQSQVPQLGAALLRGKALRVTSGDPQPDDLLAIASVLGLKEPGTLLLVPLGIGDKPWGGILLLSPYANRQ